MVLTFQVVKEAQLFVRPKHTFLLSKWEHPDPFSKPFMVIWGQNQRIWHINALELKVVELALWEF